MTLRNASVLRAWSVSSMRRMNTPPVWRAYSQLNSAVRALPMWKKPVGLGAKRTRTCDMRRGRSGFLACPPMEHQAASNPVNPVPPVKDSSVPALLARLAAAGRAAGFTAETFGEISGLPLLALAKAAADGRPRLYLSAGIHGDEPAPPRALLQMLEQGFFDGRADWYVCPLLNPGGMAAGTRENPAGQDLNRGLPVVAVRRDPGPTRPGCGASRTST